MYLGSYDALLICGTESRLYSDICDYTSLPSILIKNVTLNKCAIKHDMIDKGG